jgi:hypothetical protein
MSSLKLPRLPDRTPVKLTISLMPDLHSRLANYAALYRTTYGIEEPVTELIPHMLEAFLASDRNFSRPPSSRTGAGDRKNV